LVFTARGAVSVVFETSFVFGTITLRICTGLGAERIIQQRPIPTLVEKSTGQSFDLLLSCQ
jgi:hypothetical protein